jgi:hypothetical protein
LSFLAIPILFSPGFPELSKIFSSPFFAWEMISFSLVLGFFYINYYYFIPRWMLAGRYVIYGLLVLSCYGLLTVGSYYILEAQISSYMVNHEEHEAHEESEEEEAGEGRDQEEHEMHEEHENHGQKADLSKAENHSEKPKTQESSHSHHHNHHWGFHARRQLFPFLIVLVFSAYLSTDDRLKKAQRAKLGAELNYLKSQMNPHFLFNTLNSIYALTLEKSDAAPDAVVRLSGMMRYILSEANDERVDLQKEIEYLQAYIALQRLRLQREDLVKFELTGQPGSLKIAPLLLIPFIENAFKHGVGEGDQCDISITLNILPEKLLFQVQNQKVKKISEGFSSGIGIENTRTRLKMIYPGKHQLKVIENDSNFAVWLELILN